MVDVDTIRNDKRSRTLLKILEESENNKASTREIREKTGLSSDKIHYQYRKLENSGLIEFERDNELTEDGVPAMKIAILTDKALELISQGITGDVVIEKSHEKSLDELREEWDDFLSEWESFQKWASEVEDRIEKLEDRTDDTENESQPDDEFNWSDAA